LSLGEILILPPLPPPMPRYSTRFIPFKFSEQNFVSFLSIPRLLAGRKIKRKT
jgi:hypothetical protein